MNSSDNFFYDLYKTGKQIYFSSEDINLNETIFYITLVTLLTYSLYKCPDQPIVMIISILGVIIGYIDTGDNAIFKLQKISDVYTGNKDFQ